MNETAIMKRKRSATTEAAMQKRVRIILLFIRCEKPVGNFAIITIIERRAVFLLMNVSINPAKLFPRCKQGERI